MTATHFRAYGPKTAESRREINGEKQNISHEVEDVVAEGKLKDGQASFDAKDAKVSRVVFYSGSGDEAAVAGSVDVNKSGKITAELAD